MTIDTPAVSVRACFGYQLTRRPCSFLEVYHYLPGKVLSGSCVPLVTQAVLGLTLVNPVERWGAISSSRVRPVTAARTFQLCNAASVTKALRERDRAGRKTSAHDADRKRTRERGRSKKQDSPPNGAVHTSVKPGDRMTKDREESFWNAYEATSWTGGCDAPGGHQYYRVLAAWLKAGEPAHIEAFIREHANNVFVRRVTLH